MSDFPELGNADIAKNPAIETLIIRLLELFRNPRSVTMRGSGLEKAETSLRNQVDFLVLERIYTRDDTYRNMSISSLALSQGRRTEKVQRNEGKGKISYVPMLTGFKLAETLSFYEKVREKKMEHGSLFRFMQQILNMIADRISDNFSIPHSFLVAPNVLLRSTVRKGPKIKTKTGERTNLYVPFSFVKSSECIQMSESTKKNLTDCASGIMKNLDTINKYPVKVSSKAMRLYEEYVKVSYIISDEIRKEWRTSAKVISNSSEIKELLSDNFVPLTESDNYNRLELERYIKDVKNFKLVFKNQRDNPKEQEDLILQVVKEQKDKRDQRAKAR
jgi:hypothetical protein